MNGIIFLFGLLVTVVMAGGLIAICREVHHLKED
jgi:hypothetical protein